MPKKTPLYVIKESKAEEKNIASNAKFSSVKPGFSIKFLSEKAGDNPEKDEKMRKDLRERR